MGREVIVHRHASVDEMETRQRDSMTYREQIDTGCDAQRRKLSDLPKRSLARCDVCFLFTGFKVAAP
jgi:hypothetical protein